MKKEKAKMFRDLVKVSFYQTGVMAGFDRYYRNKSSLINAVRRIYNEVKGTPKKFGITDEIVKMVDEALEQRLKNRSSNMAVTVAEPETELAELTSKELVVGAKRKAWVALHKKLDRVLKYKKDLRTTPLAVLGNIAGITFDKGQIIAGEATEHIALKAKISEKLTPEDKMELLLKLREQSSISQDAK